MGNRRKTMLYGIFGLSLGVVGTLLLLRARPDLAFLLAGDPARREMTKPSPATDPFSPDPFEDPFTLMAKMHQQMAESLTGPSLEGESTGKITEREDAAYIYYDIELGPDPEAFSVQPRVEGNYLTISGEAKKGPSSKEEESQTVFRSAFTRTFPLPPGIDSGKMEMLSEQGKLTLRFPKKNRS